MFVQLPTYDMGNLNTLNLSFQRILKYENFGRFLLTRKG